MEMVEIPKYATKTTQNLHKVFDRKLTCLSLPIDWLVCLKKNVDVGSSKTKLFFVEKQRPLEFTILVAFHHELIIRVIMIHFEVVGYL